MVYENGVGAILIVRLKVVNELITQAEQFVAHDPYGASDYEKMGKPDPRWLVPIPADQRESRAALDQAAYMYLEGRQLNDGKGVYAFTPDCSAPRMELIRRIVRVRRTTGIPTRTSKTSP